MISELIATPPAGPSADDRSGLRPERMDNVQISPFNSQGEKPRHIIKDADGTHYIVTNTVGVKLIELFDGRRTLEEIRRVFIERYAIDLALEKIANFADLCIRNNLLVSGSWVDLEPADVQQRRDKRRRGNLGFYKHLFGADAVLEWLVRHRRWWCNPLTAVISALLVLAGFGFVLAPPANAGLSAPLGQLQRQSSDLYFLLLPLLLLLELSFHELAHGLACRLFGARSGGFGFGLLWGIVPIFFTDTTDAYTIDSKYRRIMVSAAGPLVDALFLGAAALIAWTSPSEGLIARLAIAYTAFPLSMLLINLNPFLIRMDGYWILSDWLEQPNLRQAALGYLAGQVRKLFGRVEQPDSLADRSSQQWKWRAIYTGYGLIALGWTATYIVAFLFSLVQSFQRLLSLS